MPVKVPDGSFAWAGSFPIMLLSRPHGTAERSLMEKGRGYAKVINAYLDLCSKAKILVSISSFRMKGLLDLY